MGKALNGTELGKGLSQRKDGRYSARFVNASGKRIEKYFDNLEAAEQWISIARQESGNKNAEKKEAVTERTEGTEVIRKESVEKQEDSQFQQENAGKSGMTVDEWFNFWIVNIKEKTVKYNTVRNYRDRYNHNIKGVIGDMLLSEIKPLHCQMVLNQMEEKYSHSVMGLTKTAMYNMFNSAVENELITSNPITRTVKIPHKPDKGKRRVLTIAEQKKFMKEAQKSAYYLQYVFVLQTGLRTGELIGLQWDDIDFENRCITVNRTIEFRYKEKKYICGEPKTKTGKRKVPLTESALNVLRLKYEQRKSRKEEEEFKEFVFLNRNGTPVKNSTYDTALYTIAKKAGMEKFSMHSLRHTFATRCIESGMKPKSLQIILGHSNIDITMNLYVHVTEEEKIREMGRLDEYLNGVDMA